MATYKELLADARLNPDNADFTALRIAYAKSPLYNPYRGPAANLDDRKSLNQALTDKDLPAALELVDRILEGAYLNAEMHALAASLHKDLYHSAEHAYHDAWFNGLMKSLLDSGNGLSFDSAITVISTDEEYVFLRIIGATPGSQALMHHDGHHFDVITARHPRTPEPMEFHFNIDIPFGWLERNRGNR